MLIKLIFYPIFLLLDFILTFIPNQVIEVVVDSSFFYVLGYGVSVIGLSNFVMMLGSVMFWYSVQLTWAVVEWIYKKIPGVS